MAAMLSPRLSSKMAGSATPKITRPFSSGSFCSASRMRRACSTGSIFSPSLGRPVQPYSSLMRYSRPSSSAAYHPTEKGFEKPKSYPRQIFQCPGMRKGRITWVHRWSS